ncbi:hypothetical protein PEC18_29715 [Paucibacter sp. O1-1]|nr:hypothetical protein [Paucibacter sp. O1-1]MDA3829919.1 hypothetical protein [Paucibacter sp. O1-1]
MNAGNALARQPAARSPIPPLAGQRVIWASRFGGYADLLVEERKLYRIPARTSSLPVGLMASLVRNNAAKLDTEEEKEHLDQITLNGLAEKNELDFLNKLFAKNEMVLNLLFNYERESRSLQ